MRAMVVDDSFTVRLLLTHQLAALGFDVTCSAGGTDALQLIESGFRADLFLFDWNMPDLPGLDLVKAVRRLERLKPSKVMMVTSETDPAMMLCALEAGADAYLMKPVNFENLSSAVGQLGFSAQPKVGRDA